jgi:hypothetical protein
MKYRWNKGKYNYNAVLGHFFVRSRIHVYLHAIFTLMATFNAKQSDS